MITLKRTLLGEDVIATIDPKTLEVKSDSKMYERFIKAVMRAKYVYTPAYGDPVLSFASTAARLTKSEVDVGEYEPLIIGDEDTEF